MEESTNTVTSKYLIDIGTNTAMTSDAPTCMSQVVPQDEAGLQITSPASKGCLVCGGRFQV